MHQAKVAGANSVEVWGTGKPRREFIFADDLADACIFTMKHYEGAETLNLGGGTDMSIRELAMTIKEVVEYPGELRFNTGKPDGIPFKALDSRKLVEMGWRPKTPFRSALLQTYRSFLQSHPWMHESEASNVQNQT